MYLKKTFESDEKHEARPLQVSTINMFSTVGRTILPKTANVSSPKRKLQRNSVERSPSTRRFTKMPRLRQGRESKEERAKDVSSSSLRQLSDSFVDLQIRPAPKQSQAYRVGSRVPMTVVRESPPLRVKSCTFPHIVRSGLTQRPVDHVQVRSSFSRPRKKMDNYSYTDVSTHHRRSHPSTSSSPTMLTNSKMAPYVTEFFDATDLSVLARDKASPRSTPSVHSRPSTSRSERSRPRSALSVESDEVASLPLFNQSSTHSEKIFPFTGLSPDQSLNVFKIPSQVIMSPNQSTDALKPCLSMDSEGADERTNPGHVFDGRPREKFGRVVDEFYDQIFSATTGQAT